MAARSASLATNCTLPELISARCSSSTNTSVLMCSMLLLRTPCTITTGAAPPFRPRPRPPPPLPRAGAPGARDGVFDHLLGDQPRVGVVPASAQVADLVRVDAAHLGGRAAGAERKQGGPSNQGHRGAPLRGFAVSVGSCAVAVN